MVTAVTVTILLKKFTGLLMLMAMLGLAWGEMQACLGKY